MSIFSGDFAANALSKYHSLIEKESDRGAVILATSILDIHLKEIIIAKLIDSDNVKRDELFSGPYAPLHTFSSKIEMAYRLGLISSAVKKQLKSLKAIRNDFAHSLSSASFSVEPTSSQFRDILEKLPEITLYIYKTLSDQELISTEGNPTTILINEFGCRNAFNILFAITCMAISLLPQAVEKIQAQAAS